MTTAWAHLPNAAHIDRVLASLAAAPELWTAARDAARDAARVTARDAAWGATWDATRDATRDVARGAARLTAWDAARVTARDAARGATRDATRLTAWDAARVTARDAAWDAAWDAIAALVAWDDCAVFLDMPPDAVRLVAASGHHPAVLLLPAAIVFSKPSVSNAI